MQVERLLQPGMCCPHHINDLVIPPSSLRWRPRWPCFADEQADAHRGQVLPPKTTELGSHGQDSNPDPSDFSPSQGGVLLPWRPGPGATLEPMKTCVPVPGQL